MSLSMHISKKTQKSNEKRRFRKFLELLRSFKYEFLILCEVISLICAFVFSSAGKKKRSMLFASLSTLFGAYLTLSCASRIKDGVQGRKLVDILSSESYMEDDD